MSENNIPEDIKQKINDYAAGRERPLYVAAHASFGYSLASSEISDLEQTIVDYDKTVIELREENERLKMKIRELNLKIRDFEHPF